MNRILCFTAVVALAACDGRMQRSAFIAPQPDYQYIQSNQYNIQAAENLRLSGVRQKLTQECLDREQAKDTKKYRTECNGRSQMDGTHSAYGSFDCTTKEARGSTYDPSQLDVGKRCAQEASEIINKIRGSQ